MVLRIIQSLQILDTQRGVCKREKESVHYELRVHAGQGKGEGPAATTCLSAPGKELHSYIYEVGSFDVALRLRYLPASARLSRASQ